MREQILNTKNEALSLIINAKDKIEIDRLRIVFLGRKGRLAKLTSSIPQLPDNDKAQIGKLINDAKKAIEDTLASQGAKIKATRRQDEKEEWLDVTAPGIRPEIGHLNPVTRIIWELTEAFEKLGYQIVETPEIVNDWYNFESLNIPPHHPSRDLQDTFWITENLLPRTHTSSAQVMLMEKLKPPFKIAIPGWVYRCERSDATHEFYFTHYEGFAVGKNISFADLKGTLYFLLRSVLGNEIKLKFRASYFPYVEPCAEISGSCPHCQGKGCSACGGSGWLELLGSGMIHPQVLKNAKINPEIYSGFAFCFGPHRLAMIKYKVNDMRIFNNANLRILQQF
ncbi:phenylalanine--tRNA ligase subunit alpha [Candidatus Shapirobacteria bacterium]|nr:phenylalanine--tRNA ligase subunit alpha [Candidatus Shapirobacteria bacterium]